jgi:alpha-mannosidase
LADVSARYETPHGWVDRDEEPGTEVPALRWTHLAGTVDGKQAGLAVVNTGQSGQSVDGGTLSVRLIRSSYSPDPLPEAGEHKMSLALAPHGGKLTPAQVADLAECLDQPAVVVPATVHEGPLPASGGMVTKVQPASVRLVAVKPAEDGEGTVCRLVNYGTRAATAKVSFDKDLAGSVASVQAVDLLERPVEGVNVSRTGQTVSASLRRRGIASVKVRFK